MLEFLKSLQNPTALGYLLAVVLGVVTSYLSDWIPGFTDLSPRGKRLFWLVAPLVAGPIVVVVVTLLGPAPITWDSIFAGLALGVTVFFSSQAKHATKLPANDS